jgi:LytR cell envelope-related transcriptional attenuator
VSQEPPRDEFDAVAPLRDGRRGAHRARRSRAAALLSAGLVAGATAAVAAGAYVLLHDPTDASVPVSSASTVGSADGAAVVPSADASPAGAVATAAPTTTAPTTTAPTTTAPTTTAPTTAAPTTAAGARATASSGSTATATAAPAATGKVDTTLPLVVLNGTRTTGLAAKASTQLHRLGWKVQSTGNDRTGAPATTVTYADADMAATAAAVADDLGGSAVRDRTATEGVLTVVLGPDYTS